MVLHHRLIKRLPGRLEPFPVGFPLPEQRSGSRGSRSCFGSEQNVLERCFCSFGNHSEGKKTVTLSQESCLFYYCDALKRRLSAGGGAVSVFVLHNGRCDGGGLLFVLVVCRRSSRKGGRKEVRHLSDNSGVGGETDWGGSLGPVRWLVQNHGLQRQAELWGGGGGVKAADPEPHGR